MNSLSKYLNDMDGLDKLINDELSKDNKKEPYFEKKNIHKHEDYNILDEERKKKKLKTNIEIGNKKENVSVKNEIKGGKNYFDLFEDIKVCDRYIYNNLFFLKEYIYNNFLLNENYNKEKNTIRYITQKNKLLNSNENIDDFIKIYDPNNTYPVMYVKKNINKKVEDFNNNHKIDSFLKKYNEKFRIMYEKVMKEIKEEDMLLEEKKKEEEKRKKREEIYHFLKKKKKKKSQLNFVEKYRANFFSELLTEESVNTEVLLWLKKWLDIINNEKNKNFKEKFEDHSFQRCLLIGGSAGKGKTTLAYVIAKHFKFNVIEINGSDDRNKDTLIPLIESTVCINSITKENNLCIIDEIDGISSSQQNIDALMKFLTKKNKNKSIIKRPIICICNDIYHKSLKELRKISKVIIVENVNIDMLKVRINQICDKEHIKISSDVVTKLIDVYKGDIRSILNTINFLYKGVQYSNNEDTYGYNLDYTENNTENDLKKKKKNEIKKAVINMELLNSYLYFKDANNNYIELLNLIYIKNKNKTLINKLFKDCYNFFYNNLANEYNYLNSYYYIFDNLLQIPFNDYEFSKLSYCLDVMSFCDHLEYEQNFNYGKSSVKTLYIIVCLFILIINLNPNVYIQYTLMHNSLTNYTRKKSIEIKKSKENFINKKLGVITYKYIYSKNFFFDYLNYIYSFFYIKEFFFKNVQIWSNHTYYKELDIPKYILVPYEFNKINKFQTYLIKVLYIMTLFNISFTNVISGQHKKFYNKNVDKYSYDKNVNEVNKNNLQDIKNINTLTVPSMQKNYVTDPYVDDFLIYSPKKNITQFTSNKSTTPNLYLEKFKYKTKNSFINTYVAEALNDLKKWVNNNNNVKEKNIHNMYVIKSSKKNLDKKNKVQDENTYIPNFPISLEDIILLAFHESYTNSFQKYFHTINKTNENNKINKEDLKKQQIILKSKILCNTDVNITLGELLNKEKQYMVTNIQSDKKIYFSGKYVKTKGYYKNVEERCNAVLQPLYFSVYI